MNHGCMASAMDESHRRIEISTCRWSSGGSAWTGFPVESHRFGPPGQLGQEHVGPTLSVAQIAHVCEYIRTNLVSDMGVAELAGLVNLSPHYFSMLFRRTFGVPPHQYVLQERITEARRLLGLSRMTLSELAAHLGFVDQSHFSRAFRKATGMTPRLYRNGTT